MKIRTDFVTNSSSSSFTLVINLELNNGKNVRFAGGGFADDCVGDSSEDRLDYFGMELIMTASPKDLGSAKSVDDLIRILQDSVRGEGAPIFDQPHPNTYEAVYVDEEDYSYDPYDFVKAIKNEVRSMDDIVKITVEGNEDYGYRGYNQSYTYDRKTGKYTGVEVNTYDDEIEGYHGGELQFATPRPSDMQYLSEDDDSGETTSRNAYPVVRAIEGTGYEGRAARIEFIKVGDPVILKADYNNPFFSPVAIEVFNTKNETLGYLSYGFEHPYNPEIAEDLDNLGARVVSVTPRSARGPRAKNAFMDIELYVRDKEAEKKAAEEAAKKAEEERKAAEQMRLQVEKEKLEAAQKAAEAKKKEAEWRADCTRIVEKRLQIVDEWVKTEHERQIADAKRRMEQEQNKVQDKLNEHHAKKSQAEQELETLKFYQFGRKKELREAIEYAAAQIEKRVQEKAEWEAWFLEEQKNIESKLPAYREEIKKTVYQQNPIPKKTAAADKPKLFRNYNSALKLKTAIENMGMATKEELKAVGGYGYDKDLEALIARDLVEAAAVRGEYYYLALSDQELRDLGGEAWESPEEIEQRKETEKREQLKVKILDCLLHSRTWMTCSDIVRTMLDEELSTPMVSALVNQMVAQGLVDKKTERRVTYFRA